jgi:hypothetical protein
MTRVRSVLYMLLALASAVLLGSEALWSRDHILLSQIWDFPVRRLLRLAGSRWRYSTPPPHRLNCQLKSKLCYDRRSFGQSILVSRSHLLLMTRFLLLSDSCGFVDVGRSLWRENGSAVYNCCRASPALSFWGPSSAGLMTIFSCLRFVNCHFWLRWVWVWVSCYDWQSVGQLVLE